MARSARDIAAMLFVIAGHDETDPSSIDRPVDDYLSGLNGSVEGLRIGVDYSFLDLPDCDPEVAALTHSAIAVFSAAGAIIDAVRLPNYREMLTAAAVGQAEALAYHRSDLQSRWSDYGRPTRASIMLGAFVSAADYVQAQRVRRATMREIADLFTRFDLIITPSSLVPPLLLDELGRVPITDLILTPYWSAAGNPAMSVPMGLTSAGLPVGLQLAGRPFDESTVLRAADAFQSRTRHHLVESPIVLDLLSPLPIDARS